MTLEEMRQKLEEINVAGLPLEHLKTLSEQADSYDLNLSRSAEELANYRIEGGPRWIALSTEVQKARTALCDEIRAQAKLYRAFSVQLDEEINKRHAITDDK